MLITPELSAVSEPLRIALIPSLNKIEWPSSTGGRVEVYPTARGGKQSKIVTRMVIGKDTVLSKNRNARNKFHRLHLIALARSADAFQQRAVAKDKVSMVKANLAPISRRAHFRVLLSRKSMGTAAWIPARATF